ncbi:MAG: hypothetical protein JWP49_1832 [Phenylobacterium sp.]|nr:hypothetical protein [Phenylobacterium sp.]
MTPNKSVLLLAASGLALTLGACKVDNRPLLARGAAPADAYNGLPQPGLPGDPGYGAPPAYGANAYPASYLPPDRAYPYAERAYNLDRAFYRAAPDYGFAYADEQPWAWQAADDSLMFAEPYGGGYRAYYYEPGAAYPYFVRDPNYGYALGQNGVLLALFDAAGALIGGGNYDRYAPTARDDWSRGYDLRSAYGRAPRYPVDQAVWSQRAPQLQQFQQPWINAPDRQPGWRQWRAAAGPAALQTYDVQRAARAAAFDPGRHDNGRHLGGDQGRPQGGDRGAQPAFNPAQPRFEPPRDAGRGQQAQRFDQGQPPHGQGRGGHGGGEQRAFAQAAPPPAAQGGWHGGGDHGHQAQAQQQPAPQQPPQQPHGGGHRHGG